MKCEDCNLVSVVLDFLRKIDTCVKEECKDVELDEISAKLKTLTPLASVVLSKWNPEIVYCLYIKGTMSFNELKRALGISSRVLSDKLKALEDAEIVSRNVKPEKPPRVYYELTDFGKTVASALVPLFVVIYTQDSRI
jgi:DNA-binding HxlR family transcriptional regulator